MFNKREKNIYYVSHLGTETVSIIDGDNYSIIKEIEIGPRPLNIIVDEKNNIYIASDRNNKVTLVEDLYDSSKIWEIANNGNIKVDSIAQKIYASDTEEVCIYSLRTGEKLGCIKGFIAAESLELDKEKKKLFVLDIFQNEIKVYDTSNFHLIKVYKDVGTAPIYMIIGEDENYIYISNKGISKGSCKGNVSLLNLKNGDVSYIDFPKGSSISYLVQAGLLLYVANNGLRRIEVVDILKKECIATVKTTLPELQRIKLSPDKKTLFVTSKSNDGKGVFERINISDNSILDSFTFTHNNSIPYDIGIVTQNKFEVEEKSFAFTGLEDKGKQDSTTAILAKKVLSTYQEKIIFSQVTIETSSKDDTVITIEDIIFKKCEVMNETKNRKIIDNEKKYSILQYDFYIPYYIECIDERDQKYIFEGKLKGTQKATLYIPSDAEQKGMEFVINSFAKLISTPVFINKSLKFDVSVLISTKVIVEEIVFIPFYKDCESFGGGGKND